MAKPYAIKFYKSKAWRKCREEYITKVFGLCEWCGESGHIVDHIEPITPDNINNPDITLNHDNLQYLCLDCHNRKTFQKHSPLREGFSFSATGELLYSPHSKKV